MGAGVRNPSAPKKVKDFMASAIFDFLIPFLVVLGVLVFIHELGHHLAAKLFGMKVDAFSLGFPPRAWGFRWGSKRLRKKFQADSSQMLASNAEFGHLFADIAKSSGQGTREEFAVWLSDAFSVRSETVEKEVPNKKGKMEKREETVMVFETAPKHVESAIAARVSEAFQSHPDLLDLVCDYASIQDDKKYAEKFQTDYCLSWIPLGGYCKINGMVDESLDPDSMKEGAPKPWEFRAKPVWKRVIVISGGVIFNFILAALIFATVGLVKGIPELPDDYRFGTKIGSVLPNSPAHKAGLQAGDQILKIDDYAIKDWDEVLRKIGSSPGQTLRIEWDRASQSMRAEVTTETVTEEGVSRGRIGISPLLEEAVFRPAGFGESIVYGFGRMAVTTATIVDHLGQLMTGKQSVRESLGGPIMILQTTGAVKQQQGWEGIWYLMALLSISLAVFNLFPIPALDGGHLVFLFIEAVIRKPISLKVRLYTQQIGMAILLTFIAYVVFNDIVRWTGVM